MERSHEGMQTWAILWTKGAMLLLLTALLLTTACDREEPAESRTQVVDAPSAVERGSQVRSNTTPGEETSVKAEPEEPVRPTNVTFAEAERVFHTGAYGEAADLFDVYIDRRPENPWGFYMLGLASWRDGDLDRAETALRRTLELDEKHTRGRLNLARVVLEKGKAHDAIELGLGVVETEPEMGEAWRVVGNAHAQLGDSKSATEAYQKAILIDSEDAWTMNNLGLLRIRMGDYEAAVGPLVRATDLRPEQPSFQNNLGIALESTGRESHAAEAFKAALDAAPEYGKAEVSLERVRARLPDGSAPDPEALALFALDFEQEVERWKEGIGIEAIRTEGVPAIDTTGTASSSQSPMTTEKETEVTETTADGRSGATFED